jgi:hypothetical protein
METYNIEFNKETNKGVWNVSWVLDPAIVSTFITLSNQKELKLATVNEEQRILIGPILIPDQLIYRNQDGHEFNIVFSKETIKEIQLNFAEKGYQNNAQIEHSGEQIENTTFVETWIKEDDVHDKSVLYGFDEPIGTLFGLQKINNDVIWNEYVKTGKVKGFSIDGVFDMQKINLNNEQMDVKKIVDAIKEEFAKIKLSSEPEVPAVVELATMKLKDGVTVLEAESFEVGQSVFIVAENGDKVPAPVGEHELEDGSVLIIVEEGKIAEIKTVETEVEEEVAMTNADQFAELVKSIVTSMSTEVGKQFETLRAELKAEIAETKTNVEVKASTKSKPQTKNEPTTAYERFREFNKQFN